MVGSYLAAKLYKKRLIDIVHQPIFGFFMYFVNECFLYGSVAYYSFCVFCQPFSIYHAPISTNGTESNCPISKSIPSSKAS